MSLAKRMEKRVHAAMPKAEAWREAPKPQSGAAIKDAWKTELESFHDANVARLPIWVVYCINGQHVAQMWFRAPDDAPVLAGREIKGKTLKSVRKALPRRLFWAERQPGDDPTIVETWV